MISLTYSKDFKEELKEQAMVTFWRNENLITPTMHSWMNRSWLQKTRKKIARLLIKLPRMKST